VAAIQYSRVNPEAFMGADGLELADTLASQRFDAWQEALDRTDEELIAKLNPNDAEYNCRTYQETAEEGGLYVAEDAGKIVGQLSLRQDVSSRLSGFLGDLDMGRKRLLSNVLPNQPGKVYLKVGSIAVSEGSWRKGVASNLLLTGLRGRRAAQPVAAYVYDENEPGKAFFTANGFALSPEPQVPRELDEFANPQRLAHQYRYGGVSVGILRSILTERTLS
jgi:ribosomal protein S18 acetylase RimI-like enzyme